MSRQRIIVLSIVAALVLGIVMIGTMVYINAIQQGTNAAVAVERAHFEATQTADAVH